jgi:hypothetical protein
MFVHNTLMREDKARKEKITRAVALMVDSINGGDKSDFNAGLEKLIELQVPSEVISRAIFEEQKKRMVTQDIRDTVGTTGNITPNKARKFLRQEELTPDE